jgi:translation elongation factor EF-1beta
MDYLKALLYGKKERGIDSLINTVRIFSEDIGMTFGLEKCPRFVVEGGKVKQTDDLQLNIGNIQDVEVSQKYACTNQGILQRQENLQQEVKSKALTPMPCQYSATQEE